MESSYYTNSEDGYEASTGIVNQDYSSMVMDSDAGMGSLAIGGFFIFIFLFIIIASYIYYALSFRAIARKTGTPNDWYAWVPVLNLVLMINVARKPLWWLALLFIPFVNIVMSVLLWIEVAKAVGKPEWWGVLIIVPVINIAVPGYLGFSKGAVPVYGATVAPVESNGDAFVYDSKVVSDEQSQSQGAEIKKQINQLEQDLQQLQQDEVPESTDDFSQTDSKQNVAQNNEKKDDLQKS